MRAIATGLGVTYEDLTGDYTDLPYSAARMSRIRYWTHVTDWREQMLVPQFCQPVWRWALEAGAVIDVIRGTHVANWTAPPMPLLDPDKEGLAIARLIRIGAMTWPEMQRERGNDPDVVLREIGRMEREVRRGGRRPRQRSAQDDARRATATQRGLHDVAIESRAHCSRSKRWYERATIQKRRSRSSAAADPASRLGARHGPAGSGARADARAVPVGANGNGNGDEPEDA